MAALLRYLIVGGTALVVHLTVLQVLLRAQACAPTLASAIGFVVACAFNYTLQRLWVFRSDRSHASALPRYVAITTFMLGANIVTFTGLTEVGSPPLIAQTLTTGCIFVLNFIANRFFTFRVVSP